jgi:hypothetical protein
MKLGDGMFSSGQSFRAFISGAFVALLLASIVAAQDNPGGATDAAALSILNINPPYATDAREDGRRARGPL